MPKVRYISHRFSAEAINVVDRANAIIDDYVAQGFRLTLRQLYYQFVARDIFPDDRRWRWTGSRWVRDPSGTKNAEPNYTWIGSIINDARLAGLVDWEAIEDRTRNLRSLSHWESPSEIIRACSEQYRVDKWATQEYRPECFLPQTPAVTRRGIVPLSEVKVGDWVLTHRGRFKRVTKVIRTMYDGEILLLNPVGIETIGVTPNHLFFADKCDHKTRYQGIGRKFIGLSWIASNNLKRHDVTTIPLLKKRKRLPATIHTKGGTRSKEYSFKLDGTALAVSGLYLAEGCIRCDKRTVQFTFNSSEIEYADLVCKWALDVGVEFHVVLGKGTRVVYLFSKALCIWFSSQFGNGAFNKHVPQWIMEAPEEQQMVLLEYYFRGDGTFWDETRSAPCAGTRSHQLALQVQLILLWAKFACSINDVLDHGKPTYRVSVGGKSADDLSRRWGIQIPAKGIKRNKRYNHIRFSDDYARLPLRDIAVEHYCGWVFNLEVKDDHSYCTPISAHNCWIEKDALVGVIEEVCQRHDIPHFSCRGYTSQSEMWAGAQRLLRHAENGQTPIILHFGDHDPSGVDMTRDIRERLELFTGEEIEVRRLALNMDQVEEYGPPPNPAKLTDSRCRAYIASYGDESWELDALEPQVLSDLVQNAIVSLRDDTEWQKALKKERAARNKILKLAREA